MENTSNANNLSSKKNGYFSVLLKKGYALYSLFLTVLLCTLVVIAKTFGYAGFLRAREDFTIFLSISLAIVATVLLFAETLRIKEKRPLFVDSVFHAMFLSGAFSLIYLFLLGRAGKDYVVFSSAITLVGLVFSVVNAVFSGKSELSLYRSPVTKTDFYRKKFTNRYVFAVVIKYGFGTVFAACGILACAGFLAFDVTFLSTFVNATDDAIAIKITAVCSLAFFVLWAGRNSVNDEICSLDLVLLSSAPALMILLAQSLTISRDGRRITAFAILLCSQLVLFIYRLKNYDGSYPAEKPCEKGSYFKSLHSTHGVFLAIAVGLAFCSIFSFSLTSGFLSRNVAIEDGVVKKITVGAIPYCALVAFAVIASLSGLATGLASVNTAKVSFADFACVLNLAFSLPLLFTVAYYKNAVFIVVAIAFALLSVVIFSLRVRAVIKA